MKRFLFFFALLFVAGRFFAASYVMNPAYGAQYTHPMVPEDGVYSSLVKEGGGNLSYAYDNLAIALVSGTNISDDDRFSFSVTTATGDGFYFVSDDNPAYKRPFTVYALKRPEPYNSKFIEYGEEYPSGTSDKIWYDIVIQLPGKASSGGVDIDGTFYPLIQGTYSAELIIEFTHPSGTGTVTEILRCPIAGYYSMAGQVLEKTSAALAVNTYPSASIIDLRNLLDPDTTSSVAVGKMDFLVRLSNSATSIDPDDGTAEHWLFLSSSPNPYIQDPNGFMFVHNGFVPGEDVYSDQNSLKFEIDVKGDSSLGYAGLNAFFDGTDYFNGNSVNNYIKSKCTKVRAIINSNIIHYHSFSGDIIVRVDPEADRILQAGQYSAKVYVHVIAKEEVVP